MGRCWFVWVSNVGLASCIERGHVGVNFWVRHDATGLEPDDIKAGDVDLRWPVDASTRTKFARQLHVFASVMAVGDTIVAADAKAPHLAIGQVAGEYRYDHSVFDLHPHVRPVAFNSSVTRQQLASADVHLPRQELTVKELDTAAVAAALPGGEGRFHREPVASTPASPAPVEAVAPPAAQPKDERQANRFSWIPQDGAHRLVLRQEWDADRPAFVLIGVNPGGNDLQRLRRSTACHKARAWAERHDFGAVVWVNLFTRVQSTAENLEAAGDLNHEAADESIREAVSGSHGPVVCGWGNRPSGISRTTWQRRQREVAELAGAMWCVGLTTLGEPMHPRRWDVDANLRRWVPRS